MNKASWRIVLLAGLLGSGQVACTKAPAADTERTALDAAIQRWVTAVNAQDAPTLAATMTRDVELLGANAATATGRDAAVEALREVATRGRLVATTREIAIADDVAWHVVVFVQTRKNGDVHARGQALEIWKRAQGGWQLHRQMAAGIISPDVSVTRPALDEPVLDSPKN